MKKRIILAVIGLTLVLALTACVPDVAPGANESNNEQPATQAENTPANNAQTPNASVETPANDTSTNDTSANDTTANNTTNTESQQTSTPGITEEQAKSIAFAHAGVNSSNVYDLEWGFDQDDGISSYEIEFKADRTEYSYDIHAETGEILKAEKDYDD